MPSISWIKMQTDLERQAEVALLSSRCARDTLWVVGALHAVWSAADSATADGMLRGYSLARIDQLVRAEGFGAAMVEAGWLIDHGAQGIEIPNFTRHNGHSAKARAQGASRQASSRSRSRAQDGKALLLSRAQRDKSVTREEKRREEEELKSPSETSSPEPAKPPARGQVAGEWGRGRIRFRPSDGTWIGIEPSDHALWANAYPAVDIPAALARAAAWCVANPAKGRKSNYAKFLASWLSREQDRGGSQGPSRRPAGPESRPTAAQIHAKRSLHEFED